MLCRNCLKQTVVTPLGCLGPRIRIYGMSIEGPIYKKWPTRGHRMIIGNETNPKKVDIASTFTRFAGKAFRRPVEQAEIQHYIDFTKRLIDKDTEHGEAIKLGLTAILTSPRFLFLDEGDPDKQKLLDDYELASRLSYTFWSSMPDSKLSKLAASGELRKPDVLMAEVDRLLKNPRSEAFTRNFSEAWLRLDKLGSMPPSGKEFKSYYRDNLEKAMKTETLLFFDAILAANRPVTDFVDANTIRQ